MLLNGKEERNSKMSNEYVVLQDINKNYGKFQASKHISFAIPKGSLTALLGPSGSGKTTILRMIAGLEQPDSGDIIIDGKVVNQIPASQRGIGFVFQNYALFRYMTVFDNVAFGLKVKKIEKKLIKKRVKEVLDLVGLSGMEKRYPSQLSGGQRQRVAFARAIAPNPALLLLDEPFAAIDAKVRKELRTWLKNMIGKLGITSIFVTHDQDEAIEVADKLIVTNQGKIEQIGSPLEIYQNPLTPFTAKFFGNTSEVLHYENFDTFEVIPDYDHAYVRPEFIRVTKKNEPQKYSHSAVEGIVEQTFFRGDNIEIHIRVGENLLFGSRELLEDQVSVGEPVDLFISKLFVTKGDQVIPIENLSMIEDPLVI